MDTIKTGELIAEKRKELGLTQMQLGEELHVSDKTISKWETGVISQVKRLQYSTLTNTSK